MNDVTEITGLRRYPFARRGFVMTSLISGFTLATQRVEAQAIQTDTSGIDAGEVQIPVKDGHIPAYYARPAKGSNFPTILVNEEIFGVHEYIKDICRRLAKLGYMAVAPEIYARIADLSKMTDAPHDIQRGNQQEARRRVVQRPRLHPRLGRQEQRQRQRHRRDRLLPRRPQHLALRHPQPPPESRRSVLRPGQRRQHRHPAKDAVRRRRPTEVPAARPLRRQGHLDPGTRRRGHRRQGESRAQNRGNPVYPDSPHGFHADYRPSYHEADAKDAWTRMLAWFKHYGVAPKGTA